MLGSIPAALLAVFWPVAGALLVVALNRILPNWLGRLLALAASIASLVALFSLLGGVSSSFRGTWEPFTFLRTSPALWPTPLGVATGVILAAWCAVAAIGIRGSQHPKTTWYGFALLLLAGGLVMALAGNLMTLVLGSALLDLGLILLAVSGVGGEGQDQRTSFRMCMPGLASTGLLVLAALRMDSSSGTQSLAAQDLVPEVLALLAAAGLFRAAIFPLHLRGLRVPEQASVFLLSIGSGVFLMARAQSLGGSPAGLPWFLAIGALGLGAGGWLAWGAGSGPPTSTRWAEVWSALAVQQSGAALLFALLFPGAAPWPLAGLVLALGMLAIWWDATQLTSPSSPRAWIGWLRRQWPLVKERLRSWARRLPLRRARPAPSEVTATAEAEAPSQPGKLEARGKRPGSSWLARRGAGLLPIVALASLAGMPLTVGSVTRWHLVGVLLTGAHPWLLAGLLLTDVFLAAGLILAWQRLLWRVDAPRPGWLVLSVMGLLAAVTLALWLAPGLWVRMGLPTLPRAGASAWGVGILFVLPWLLGAWLAKVTGSVERLMGRLRRAGDLDRVLRPAGWLARKVATAVFWLGSVGEGEGWWGWALVVLALGALYLLAR